MDLLNTSRVASDHFLENLSRLKITNGGIEFDWRAVRLIDCPLVQRLRFVKQLGFTYLTYPSAEHSRFSHSLGVAHVVSKFIDSINKRSNDAKHSHSYSETSFVGIDALPDLSQDDLIHAAILHDVGHLPFSHVTEKVIEGRRDLFTCGGIGIEEITLTISKNLGKSLLLSEILSIMLILSKRFEKYYYSFIRPNDANNEDALLRIASLIAGLPPYSRLTGIPELISSASVDSDRIDYVNRDARNCGVPVGVDVARIFLRSGVVHATRDQIKMWDLKDDPEPEEYLFVVNSSGIDTIDEILQARTALYQRVYFHPVTRTAERLLGIALEANATCDKPDNTTSQTYCCFGPTGTDRF